MRKSLTALLLVAALPTLAFAMPDAGHGERQGKRAGHLFEQLDLSRDQQREIRQLMGQQMKARHEITQRYLDKLPAAERKAMQDELASSQDKIRQQIQALLAGTAEAVRRHAAENGSKTCRARGVSQVEGRTRREKLIDPSFDRLSSSSR